VTYLGGSLGATIGATAWTLMSPRFIPWVGLIFIVAALACSVRGERAARDLPDA
jgi:predicted MFS family arabinose efflux permease